MCAYRMTRRRALRAGTAALAATATPRLGAPSTVFANAPAVQTGTTLKVMVWGRPDAANWDYAAYQHANPEGAKSLTIEPVVGGGGDAEVAEQFRLMLAAGGGDLPDIIYLNRIQVPEFASADALADLTDQFEPYRADVIDTAYQLTLFDERVVAVPSQLKSKAWFYRADLMEQAGVAIDKVVTMDDFIAAGLAYHEAMPDSYIWNLRSSVPGNVSQGIVTSYAPVSFYDRDAGKFVVDSHPGFRALFETIDKFRNPDLVAPVDDFSPDWSPAFASGQLAGSLIMSWMASFLPQYVPDQAGLWKVREWPTLGDSNQGSDSGGSVFVIPKQGKNVEAAFEYLATAHLSKEGALGLMAAGNITPVVKTAREVVPTMPAPDNAGTGEGQLPWGPDFFGDDYFPVIFATQEKLAWIDFDPRGAQEIALMNEWTGRALAGDADVEQAIDGLQSDLEGQIGDPWLV